MERKKHAERVLAALLVLILCLSKTITAAADEVSMDAAKTETAAISPEEIEPAEIEAAQGEAVQGEPEMTGNEPGSLQYETKEDGTVIIIGYVDWTEMEGPLEIPPKIEGKDVTEIGEYAFYGCEGLTGDLKIPDTVTKIGTEAFRGCSGFTGSLALPDSVTSIGSSAFGGCSGFTGSLTIPDGVTSIGDGVFQECIGFTGSLTIPDGVTRIGESAFDGCSGLSGSLTLPANVTEINNWAFYGCKGLSGNLTIPDTVSKIDVGAFQGCSGFTGNLTLPAGLNTIGGYAFSGCSGLSGNLTLPDSVTSIGNGAFDGCSGLSGNLTLPDSLNTIGNYAFQGCSGFTGNLTIPDKVTSIGDDAFSGCYNLSTISNNSAQPLEVSWFWDTHDVDTECFTDEEGKKYYPGDTFGKGCFKREAADLKYELDPDRKEVTVTGHKGGKDVTGSLVIPVSVNVYPVTRIGSYAFQDCIGFTGNLTIPDGVTSIGEGAFSGCSGLSGNLTIPESVQGIGEGAFRDCYRISVIRNLSSNALPASDFWAEEDTATVCFMDPGRREYAREDDLPGKGTYERMLSIPVQSIVLDQTSLELDVGSSGKLTATVSPSNAYCRISWNSSASEVAAVKDGVVTGVSAGSATITVSADNGAFTASCNVLVKSIPVENKPVTGVSLNRSNIGLYVGESETLNAAITPADATDQGVQWFSSNEKAATVKDGVVKAVSAGSAVITVSTNDGGFTASCGVTVYKKTEAYKVIFRNEDGSVYAAQTVEKGAQAVDPGSPAKEGHIFIGWSDGTSIWNFTIPVNKDLDLTAKYKAEQVEVKENTGSGMDPVPVAVSAGNAGEKTAYKLYLVKGQSFTAEGTGFKSANTAVAAVAKSGKITGKGRGEATVENDSTLYTVYVAEPSISKNSQSISILVGSSADVGFALNAQDGALDQYPVTWHSDNPKVAVVNGGTVTAVAKGSTKITASVGGRNYSAKVKVTDICKAPGKQKGGKAEFAMNPLQSFNLKFETGVFKVKGAVWSGDGMTEVRNRSGKVTGYQNKVISVTNSGKFTAIGPGTTTVSGMDSASKMVVVTVTVVPVATKVAAYITKEKTETVKFPKVTNKKAEWWKSSDEKAAVVDTAKKSGKVTGKACGYSEISCLYKGFTFHTKAYIEDPKLSFSGKEVKDREKLFMTAGEMKQFKVDQVYQTLNFKSSKRDVAFVDENGFVYARKAGKTTISTKINGKTYKLLVEVK